MTFSKNKNVNILICLIIFSFCLTNCSNHSKTDKNKLLEGMYKMYSIQSQDSTGAWKESGVANGGESYILYDGLGHMAVQITPKGYKDFEWLEEEVALNPKMFQDKVDSMSVPELKQAVANFASYYAYVANYRIDKATNTIIHERLIGTIPSIWGTEVKRQFSFSGDTLILINPLANRRLMWLRQE